MGASLTYYNVWKWVAVDWSLFQYYYWEDFNPTNNERPVRWDNTTAYQETSNFNLSWFQPWHEVWCWVWQVDNTGDTTLTFTLNWDFQRYRNWTRSTSWSYQWSGTLELWWNWGWYMYFGVDDDEIRDWYSQYRIRWIWASSEQDIFLAYSDFTVSNLNIDSNLYNPWCLRLDWAHLYYTDSTWFESGYNGYWYKHRIAYDSSVWEYVWREYAWSIWMENSWSTAMKRIYYVTKSGYKTRTYWYQERYWWNVNVWNRYRWSIRVPTWDAEYWYWHLCYVTADGQKLRVLNWPPAWYV
jgi:hypothetical protein